MKGAFFCYICRDTVHGAITYKLSCGHVFCKPCLLAQVKAKLDNNKIKCKCCFPMKEMSKKTKRGEKLVCSTVFTDMDMRQILSLDRNPLFFEKYSKLKYLKENAHVARTCPRCESIALKLPSNQNSSDNEIQCRECKLRFCFVHGEAHHRNNQLTEPCASYTKRIAKEQRASTVAVSKISKPCPGCGAPVEKAAGCNHLTCEVCETSFCWLCGKKVSDNAFPAHFQWWNPMGCVNMQVLSQLLRVCNRFTVLADARGDRAFFSYPGGCKALGVASARIFRTLVCIVYYDLYIYCWLVLYLSTFVA